MKMNNKEYNDELVYQANQVATEDIDTMNDSEVAEYLGIETDEVNWDYRNDAIEKKMEELLELWSSTDEEE